MSNKMRWRYADTNPVVAAVDSESVIEIGDLLWLDEDDAKPASDLPDVGSKAANQELFADRFLGVAMQHSPAGENTPVRVAATGVFEFDCPSSTFELGDLVGVDENGAGSALLNQQVVKVNQGKYAIGRVARREPLPVTSVWVAILSTVMTGGVEGTSPSGA
jgi:hypothetical protein